MVMLPQTCYAARAICVSTLHSCKNPWLLPLIRACVRPYMVSFWPGTMSKCMPSRALSRTGNLAGGSSEKHRCHIRLNRQLCAGALHIFWLSCCCMQVRNVQLDQEAQELRTENNTLAAAAQQSKMSEAAMQQVSCVGTLLYVHYPASS